MKAREIFRLMEKRPFRPFVIELDNGKRLRIRHPENLIAVPDRASLDFFIAVIPGRERDYCYFEPVAITALEYRERNGG